MWLQPPDELSNFFMIQFFKMSAKRVLIVDDQRDIRQLLRDSIQLLGGNIDIVDVPSGEEAMLVISRQHFDLLVTDVRLAGMSGLELVRKVRKRNPGLKVILVTGMTDIEIRQQVSQAGAEAFFFKPVEIASFQSAVMNCLEPKEASGDGTPHKEGTIIEKPAKVDSASRLERLRASLEADCVLWVDASGEVLERSEGCPAGLDENELVQSVLEGEKVWAALNNLLGDRGSRDYSAFWGIPYRLHLCKSTVGHMLIALTCTTEVNSSEETARRLMTEAAAVLETESADTSLADVAPQEGPSDKTEEEPPLDEADLSELDMVFQGAGENKANTQELDEFWDTAVEHTGAGNLSDRGSITYEQALRMGIVSKEDSE